MIEQASLSGSDFSALSLCLNIRQRWLPRRIMLNAGRIGIIFRVKIKGFIDLNETPSNPSSPESPLISTPIYQPVQPAIPQHHNQHSDPNICHPIHPINPNTNGPVQAMQLHDNLNSPDEMLHSPDVLRLTPQAISPRRSLSSLQITVGEHQDISNYILLARNHGNIGFMNTATPDSVQQSNVLPISPQLVSPAPPQEILLGTNMAMDQQIAMMIQESTPTLQALNNEEAQLNPGFIPRQEPLLQEAVQVEDPEPSQHEIPDMHDPPAAPVMVPLQEPVQEPVDRPRRSSRLAGKSQGMYISAMEKAVKRRREKPKRSLELQNLPGLLPLRILKWKVPRSLPSCLPNS
jgi:hypothetical protein